MGRIAVRDRWDGRQLARRLSHLSFAFISALGGCQFLGALLEMHAAWRVGFALMVLIGCVVATLSSTLSPEKQKGTESLPEMLYAYLGVLRRREFLLSTLSGGAGYAAMLIFQEASPFILKTRYYLSADSFGNIGILAGAAYFLGALVVNRYVVLVGHLHLMKVGALIISASGILMFSLQLGDSSSEAYHIVASTSVYCAIFFGQAILFPNSMAAAVGGAKGTGSHAITLCSFIQQTEAGLASAAAVTLNGHLWAPAVAAACLGMLAWRLARCSVT